MFLVRARYDIGPPATVWPFAIAEIDEAADGDLFQWVACADTLLMLIPAVPSLPAATEYLKDWALRFLAHEGNVDT
jgi:hypothetical protein